MSRSTEFSIGEVLSKRGRLGADEISALLQALPSLLDDEEPSSTIGSFFTDLRVVFGKNSVARDAVLASRVNEWPRFNLELRRRENRSDATTLPVIPFLTAGYPTRLAGFIYELAGGRLPPGCDRDFRYTPVASLSEEANQALKEMLIEREFTDCGSLWSKWLRETGTSVQDAAGEKWQIPKWALQSGRSATDLDLVGKLRDQLALRFVARDEFRIGRSPQHADLALEIRTAKGDGIETSMLSRVHVLAHVRSNGIYFFDGDGSSKSANGSALAGTRLGSQKGELLRGSCDLALAPGACDCRVKVEPFSSPFARSIPIANLSTWKGGGNGGVARQPAPCAAVAFRPARSVVVAREVFWIFSAVGLRTVKGGRLECGLDDTPELMLLHARGCFWLGCLLEPAERVAIDNNELAPGQIVPLGEQIIDIGQQRYFCRPFTKESSRR